MVRVTYCISHSLTIHYYIVLVGSYCSTLSPHEPTSRTLSLSLSLETTRKTKDRQYE